ncbi:MAG: CHAT domain-containing protein [Acidobacteriaceae bacterium]|nr:CHAT domain-containing protein [Acidobacteriaceae bacterium]
MQTFRVTGNTDRIIGARTTEIVRSLLECVGDDPADVDVQYRVALWYWIKYEIRSRADENEFAVVDFTIAIQRFRRIYRELAPDAIPAPVSDIIDHISGWAASASDLLDHASGPGGLTAVDKAIELFREVAEYTMRGDPDWPILHAELATALLYRFELSTDLSALNEAVERQRESLNQAEPDGEAWRDRICVLKLILLARHEHTGDPTDLSEARTLGQQVLDDVGQDHPKRANYLSDMAEVWLAVYRRTDELSDLDRAIQAAQQALDALPEIAMARVSALASLGIGLRCRGERFGAVPDLDNAVRALRQAVAHAPIGITCWNMLNHLGNALRVRGAIDGDRRILKEAVDTAEEAVSAADPIDRSFSGYLQSLAVASHAHYASTKDIHSLQRAVDVSRRSLGLTPPGPMRLDRAMNLSSALQTLSEVNDDDSLLVEAIRVQLPEISQAAPEDPALVLPRTTLGAAFRRLYRRSGDETVRTQAVEQFRIVAQLTSASPSARVRAARSWGWLEVETKNWTGACNGLGLAVELLPRLAGRHLDRIDQERQLETEPGLVSHAAAAAINAGDLDRAVELLELGRGVLLGHALDLRTDLTELREKDQTLADEFIALQAEFDREHDHDMYSAAWYRNASDRRHELASRWEALLGRIRQLVTDFLCPIRIDNILTHAIQGPIVIINVSTIRSDALAITPNGVTLVPLPRLTPSALVPQNARFVMASRAEADDEAARDGMRDVLGWLWEVATGPILKKLGISGPPNAGAPWPRIWWSPTSILQFLPLHASGHHGSRRDAVTETVMDRVVSSYTPTIRALVQARELSPVASRHPDPLVVAVPDAPGLPYLSDAASEAKLIAERYKKAVVLDGDEACPKRVLRSLREHHLVHFACHGASDILNPSAAHLCVGGGAKISVLDIARSSAPSGEFVYLSACQTVQASITLADEAIHLAAAFQVIGYRHVLATMWTIYDHIAVDVAQDVYAKIMPNDGTIGDAAFILHHAVRRQRDRQPRAPGLWASYVHYGP